MNKTDRLALDIREWIVAQPAYQNYLHSHQEVMKHKELVQMEQELKMLQQQIIELKKELEADVDETVRLYKEKKAIFENHPLVVNYLADQAELNALFQYIVANIEANLKE